MKEIAYQRHESTATPCQLDCQFCRSEYAFSGIGLAIESVRAYLGEVDTVAKPQKDQT